MTPVLWSFIYGHLCVVSFILFLLNLFHLFQRQCGEVHTLAITWGQSRHPSLLSLNIGLD